MFREIYNHLPLGLQNILITLQGERIQRFRYGGEFEELYRDYLDRGSWTSERVQEYKDGRLSAFLSEVFQCPAPEALRQFAESGLMDKASARRYVRKVPLKRNDPIIQFRTSGTTGSGLVFFVSRRALQEQWAVWWRHRAAHGISREEWCDYFAAPRVVPLAQTQPPYWRINRPGRQVIYSAFHLKKATAPHYLWELKNRGHRWIHGYPEIISSLAAYANELGLKVPMKWVTTSSENLLPNQIRLIEQVFGVKPIQHYGLKEGVANISECAKGKLHVDEDYSHVEFIKAGQEENSYRIVGTNFTNPAFPLLRYDTGDLATLIPGESCDCGRPGRVVTSIDGRREDYVVTASGKLVGLLDLIFENCVNVYSAQIIQDRPGFVSFRIVRSEAYGPKDESRLRVQIGLFLGNRDEIDYDIQYVNEIAKTPGGKHRLVISSLKPDGRADGKI